MFSAAPTPLPGWVGWNGHAAQMLARVFFAVRNRDVLCPYRLTRREIFARIPLQSDGTFVHVEILAKANFLGCMMDEIVLADRHQPPPLPDVREEMRRVFRDPRFRSPVPLLRDVPEPEPAAPEAPAPSHPSPPAPLP